MGTTRDNNRGGMDDTTKVVLAALVGAGIGAAVTLLFTTEKGGNMLDALKSPLKSVSDSLDELVTAGKDAMDKVGKTAQEATENAKQHVADMVKDQAPEEVKKKAK